jgi:hypothetical protein
MIYVRMGIWQYGESLLFAQHHVENPLPPSFPRKRESSFFIPCKYPGFPPARE